jgi:hypothetical protein
MLLKSLLKERSRNAENNIYSVGVFMNTMRWTIGLILCGFLLAFLVEVVLAESFRCTDSNLVSSGDSMERVLKHCGPPSETYDLLNAFNQVIGKRLVYRFSIYGSPQVTTIDYYFDGRMSIFGK